MEIKRCLQLEHPLIECVYLVGIDDGGQFHVIGKDTWDPSSQFKDKAILMTYANTGELAYKILRNASLVLDHLETGSFFDRSAWPRLQELSPGFPASGQIHFEHEEPDLVYLPQKPFPRGTSRADDEDLDFDPVSRIVSEQLVAHLHAQGKFLRRNDDADTHRITPDEIVTSVIGVWRDSCDCGVWLEPDLALMLRNRYLVCETTNGNRTFATANVLDLVHAIDTRRRIVASLFGDGFGWTADVGGFIRTRDSLFARNVYANEYWRNWVYELAFDETSIRRHLELHGSEFVQRAGDEGA